MLEAIDLVTLDSSVSAPEGIVYSTSPRRAHGSDGADYFVKGPEPEVVFAELAGCLLASAVGLSVAPVSVARFEGQSYCGSRKVADLGRNLRPLLSVPTRVENFSSLFAVIVVDIWLVNPDRNPGNVLGKQLNGGRVELVMIDFEKSHALRPNPIVTSPTIAPKTLWPSGELGTFLKSTRPMQPPPQIVSKIVSFSREEANLISLIQTVTDAFQPVAWAPNSVQVLRSRGAAIATLAEEVWDLQ
jgi:hypothetical protein